MTRAIGPPIPPPLRRAERTEAEGIAAELVEVLVRYRAPHALFVLPNGEFRYTPTAHPRFADWSRRWPFALAGIYTADAWAKDIIEDIAAMRIEA